MNQKYYNSLYKTAFSIIGDKTPLKSDCGLVCNKACCKGDSKTGMILFPHEETPFEVIELNNRRLAVCSGECDRNNRPLACRLFPFFPVINEKGKVEVQVDYRGFGICPLIENCNNVIFSQRFIHRVKIIGDLLNSDKECSDFIKKISNEIIQEKSLIQSFKKAD